MKSLNPNHILALFLIFIGAVGRIALVNYPNVETVMVVTFIAAVYIRTWYALLVPLGAMFISDAVLGNFTFTSTHSLILIFTYSGFIMISLVSRKYGDYFRRNASSINRISVTNTSMFGLLFVVVYDVWTNFGAFLLMYPHTLNGLALCYTMAIPFMLYHLFSGAVTFALIVAPVSNIIQHSHLVKDQTPVQTPQQ
jgi:hypothetical protein